MSRAMPQSQYELIRAADAPNSEARPPSRSQFRESFRTSAITVRADESNEILRKQLHKLEYELNNIRAERELTALRHEEELRSAQRKAQADFEKAQASESASHSATSRFDALAQELREARELAAESKSELERQLRESQERIGGLREEVDEKDVEIKDQERHFQRDMNELKAQMDPLQKELESVKAQSEEKASTLTAAQQRLKESEEDVGVLQNEIVRLKAQTGDSDTLNLIKRELSEQVSHIQSLEAQNHKQRIELKKLKEERKDVELVEEQKRDLQSKLSRMGDLRKELSEAQLQRRILEDERKAWTNLLEKESSEDMDVTFERPEDLAKAYLKERLEKLSLVDQMGKLNPEMSAKDQHIQDLESQLANQRAETEKQRSGVSSNSSASNSSAPDPKLKARLERQRALAIKEVDYLRAQLKAFDDEQGEFMPGKIDESKSQRIKELEDIVDRHRKEVQTLQSELEKAEALGGLSAPVSKTGAKRSLDEAAGAEESERAGTLARKVRSLQDELNQVHTARTLVEKELSAAKSQIESMKETSRTRILELRDNPTAEAARIKQSTLDNLRTENESLLDQLEALHGSGKAHVENEPPRTRSHKEVSRSKTVPAASLERLRVDLEEKQRQLSSMEKKEKRLKSTFSAQIRQFREACASVLGWDVNILPNDRAKVTSMFDPTTQNKNKEVETDDDEEEEDEEREERSIVFDAKQGTMKVSGGPQSKFAEEIRGLIEFWVDGRKEVPCFLAACTLEFWEKGPGAQTLR